MNVENDSPFILFLNNLNGFTKIDCLSEGSFSTIHSVKDNFSGNLFCVKSFEFDGSDQSKRKIFSKYANELHNLDFPTLIPHQLFSFADLDNQYFPSFIYPFFSKQSLKKNINKLNNTNIMIILIGVSEGLRYLHQNNIAHGALEPSNILLDDQFRPILTSFGFGKMIEEFNSIDPQIPIRGTFNYLAPHYTFQSSEEFKSDIYSFGLLVYFLLVKKDPYFKCQKLIHIPSKIVSGSLPKISEIGSSEFVNFLYRCLIQIPQERPNISEVCKEISKLRLPNVDIEQINEYKEFLRQESSNPFMDFKRATYNIAQQHPTLSIQQQDPHQQYKMQLNQNLQQRLQQYQVSDPHLKEIQQRLQLQLQQRFEQNPKVQPQPIPIQENEELELINKIHSKKLVEDVIAIYKKINSDDDELELNAQPQEQQEEQQEEQEEDEDDNENQEQDDDEDQDQDNDDEDDNLLQANLPDSDDDDDSSPIKGIVNRKMNATRRKISPILHKKMLNLFSDSTSSDHNSQSEKENKEEEEEEEEKKEKEEVKNEDNENEDNEDDDDNDDDSDLPYENKRSQPRRSSQARSQNSKKKKSPSKSSKKASPKKGTKTANDAKENKEEEIDIDLVMQQVLNEDSKGGIKSIFNETEKDDELKEELQMQHPSRSNSSTYNENDKYFSNFSLSDEIKELIKSANSGDAESQNQLGVDLVVGIESVPPNPDLAFKYFQLSADQNYPSAILNLGRCYEEGKGTAVDYMRAFSLYNLAYEQGEILAASYLGHCYEEGIGCLIDKEKAAEMYKVSFDSQASFSQYLRCLLLGIGIQPDPQAAFELLSEFDESQDNSLALLKGLFYELDGDNQQAINCYNRAIDQGNNEAKVSLALLLLSVGITSPKQRIKSNFNSITSLNYHIGDSSSNDGGDDDSFVRFDDSFVHDVGDRNDPIQLLTEAAVDSKTAKVVLADCYLRGVGTDVDSRSANRYYYNAASQNSYEGTAKFNLYSSPPLSSKNINSIKMAAQNQNDAALVIYGRLLQKRIATEFLNLESSSSAEVGANADPEIEALNLFRMAADHQSPIGMCQYGKTLLKRQRRARLMYQNELFEGVENTSYFIDDQIEEQAASLVKRSADLKYKGGLYNYARIILERNGVIRVDNCDNNVVLIKSDSVEAKKRIRVSFKKAKVKVVTEATESSATNDDFVDDNNDFIDDDDSAAVPGRQEVNFEQVRVAFSYLRQAADLGNNNSRVLLGLFMKHGTFLQIEREGSLSYFDLARQARSKSGLYHFSRMYLKEITSGSAIGNHETNSIMAELKGSIKWERTPIKSKAVNLYGYCLAYAIGGIRESLQDSLIYRKNASGYPFDMETIFDSSALAAVDYGDLLNVIGKVNDKNASKEKEKERKNEAIKCYRQAYLLDKLVRSKMSPKSAYVLGMAYIKGKVINKDVEAGLEFIKYAAEKENSHALLKSAKFFLNGIPGFVDANPTLAAKIFLFLADEDNNHGLTNAGKMLFNGVGVQKDEEMGLQMLRKAAGRNDAEAVKFLKEIGK